MAGYEHTTMLDPRRVLDVGLVVISAGLLFFFVVRIDRGQTLLSSETADIGSPAAENPEVTPSITPGWQGDKRGDKRGDTMVTHRVTMVSPSVSPTVTSVASVLPTVQKSPSPSPSLALSPSPVLSKAPTPLVMVTPRVSPSPAVTPPSPPTPSPTERGTVVINEVAWMGTEASSNDEWIELFSLSTETIDLSGWKILIASDNAIILKGSIAPGGYYLLERTNDEPVSFKPDIPSDYTGSFGRYGLKDTGRHLTLVDGSGTMVDDVDCSAGWYAGLNGKGQKTTMERIDPSKSDDFLSNWANNDGVTINGYDADGNHIRGTPKARNSVAK